MKTSRRDFLGQTILGLGAALTYSNSWTNATARTILSQIEADVIIQLTATVNGQFWSYQGKLIKGPSKCLKTIPGSYLGPIIDVNNGDRVKIIFKNELPEKSIVHWHGLDVSHKNDGHPHNAIKPNETYEYDFIVQNRAGMYWYHPHPHGKTGEQVYKGLAGLFIVRDNEEKALNLPINEQELFLVLQDRYFNDEGKLEYRPTMMGAFGNTLYINGVKQDRFQVKQGLYRLRFLNGCNARIFNFSLDQGKIIQQIGSDGGLLGKINKLESFYYAPAERIDFLFDFSNYSAGDIIKLESLPLVEGQGEKYTILEFEISDQQGEYFQLPIELANYEVIPKSEAININSPKIFELFPTRDAGWTINGLGYDADKYEDYELIKFGNTEIWEFYNPTGMPHPMHIHGTQFQVLKRESGSLKGALDEGWKDTVLVLPRDRVQVIKRFNTFKGTFIYHCHNLEHEDMSMMRNFKVID